MISGLMLVYGAVMGVRAARTRIAVTPETLVVHNPWRSYQLARNELVGFSTGRYQRVGHQTAHADLRGGDAVRLVALESQFPIPGRARAIEPVLDRLEAWRTRGRAAPTSSIGAPDPSNG